MSVFSQLPDEAKAELWSVLALRHTRGIGLRRVRKLLDAYGNARAAVEEGLGAPARWAEKGLLPLPVARHFASQAWRTEAKAEWDAIRSRDCSFLLWSEPGYPEALRELPDAPALLYFKGDGSLLRGPTVAVVGARDCTREGIAVAAYLSRDLARAGVAVISGMAKGIDRAAHIASLEGPGRSIAVLGTGIDVTYPACNADLYEFMVRQGLLISEFAPGSGPSAGNFPVRNRLISGLSQGVLVVEAAARSGSLITARLALEQGREVFAVPGHTMAAMSAGCRELIRQGAKPVFCADDILVELAPLLTLQARKALEVRQGQGRQSFPAARKRTEELHVGLLSEAAEVLPPGGLPWIADSAPDTPGDNRRQPAAPIPGAGGGKRLSGRSAEARRAALCEDSGLSDEERKVIGALDAEKRHIDALCQTLDMDVSRLSSLLTLLEVRDIVRRDPGMLYSLAGE